MLSHISTNCSLVAKMTFPQPLPVLTSAWILLGKTELLLHIFSCCAAQEVKDRVAMGQECYLKKEGKETPVDCR